MGASVATLVSLRRILIRGDLLRHLGCFSALCGHTDAKHNSTARGDRQQRTAGNLA